MTAVCENAVTAPAAPAQEAPTRRWRRLLVSVVPVVALLVVLEVLLFWSYFTGAVVPAPDDFIGSYNNEPFAWWRDGSMLHPTDWVPYAWGGYPAAISIQNGSWYLPIGLIATLTPYSIHAAASLQALHVGFGALGMYVLGRRWGLHRGASLVGLVGWFFAAGFYTNALHPDIVRGFAWAPWLVLVLMPVFPWRRWWAIPAAALVIWQAVAGSYPGIVVAAVYCCAVGVLVAQLVMRPRVRAYLLPLGVAVLAAGLLSAPKYVAALELRGGASPTGRDDSIFSRSMVGTAFFPYDLMTLPNDLSMRSFFVPATCWALLALVRWRDPLVRVAAAVGGTALLLGMPFWPWYNALVELPGMSLSRFRMADFRTFLLLGVVMAAMAGLSSALRAVSADAPAGGPARRRWSRPVGTVALVALVSGAAAIGVLAHWGAGRWAPPWTLLLVAATVVAIVGRIGLPEWHGPRAAGPWAAVLVLLTVVSGVQWAYSVTPPWRADRAQIELSTWGTESDDIMVEDEPDDWSPQRPARIPLDDAVAPPTDVYWNQSFYDGVDAVGGYVNLKGSPAFNAAIVAIVDPVRAEDTRALYAASGIGIQVDGPGDLPTAEEVADCAAGRSCGPDVVVEPDGYQPGALDYDVTAERDVELNFNEAYYEGWQVTACPSGQDTGCQDLRAQMGSVGTMVVAVPAGQWDVSMVYDTPGESRNRWAFGVGLLLLGAAATVVGLRARAGQRPGDDGGSSGTDLEASAVVDEPPAPGPAVTGTDGGASR